MLVYVVETDTYYRCTGEAPNDTDFSLCWKGLLDGIASDNNVVKITGDQSIDGVKTFVKEPKINEKTITTKEYVDEQIPQVITSKVGTELQAHSMFLIRFLQSLRTVLFTSIKLMVLLLDLLLLALKAFLLQ